MFIIQRGLGISHQSCFCYC